MSFMTLTHAETQDVPLRSIADSMAAHTAAALAPSTQACFTQAAAYQPTKAAQPLGHLNSCARRALWLAVDTISPRLPMRMPKKRTPQSMMIIAVICKRKLEPWSGQHVALHGRAAAALSLADSRRKSRDS